MGIHEYKHARRLTQKDRPFYGLIMAAMKRADTVNANKLRLAFPDTYSELQARYDAPMGYLPAEKPTEEDAQDAEQAGLLCITCGHFLDVRGVVARPGDCLNTKCEKAVDHASGEPLNG